MEEIEVYRIRTERMDKDRFAAIGEALGLRGDVVATEEALGMHDGERALAWAQPGGRFAGLLFLTDQSQALGAPTKEVPDTGRAEEWAHAFLDEHRLEPRDRDDHIRVSFEIRAHVTVARIEEGEGRRRRVRTVPARTDVVSHIEVNGHHVTGPRARVRLTFLAPGQPAWMHRGLWDTLEVFETRRFVGEEEAKEDLAARLASRGDREMRWHLRNLRLAYFAGEYEGGPDLLVPHWFAEIEMPGPRGSDPKAQGPRQLVQLDAVR
ncbi:MAG: hypothetical protein LPK92_07975 [Actinomycetes bacterium]|nr:hypothetical protein [Actinomycetes bacterium]